MEPCFGEDGATSSLMEDVVFIYGGKVTLIKSILSSLPTYFLSLFPVPAKVANHMKKLRRDFLWSSIDAPKMPLVEWVKFCMMLQNGGLGIQRLRQFNYALLDKWLWRYRTERNALWRKVIEAKYGDGRGGWCTKPVTGTYGVSVWRHIGVVG